MECEVGVYDESGLEEVSFENVDGSRHAYLELDSVGWL